MLETKYVVDTTILVAWLLKPNGLTGKIVRSLELELHTPYKAVDELWKHRREWSAKNPSIDFGQFVSQIEYYVKVQELDQTKDYFRTAKSIMSSVDPDDTDFVALALFQDAPIWTFDSDFKRQNMVKIVDSDYILSNSREIPTLWEDIKEEYYKSAERRVR